LLLDHNRQSQPEADEPPRRGPSDWLKRIVNSVTKFLKEQIYPAKIDFADNKKEGKRKEEGH
jgi:hypothetical protein